MPVTKQDYLVAKETIKNYKQEKKDRPKRKCSEKQLAALAAGRAKNSKFKKQETQPEQQVLTDKKDGQKKDISH